MRPGARKLSPVGISRAGARVARRDGVDGVTMRSVAAAVGVTPMALYRCFDSADALRSAAVSAALERVPNPPTEGSATARLSASAHTARGRERTLPGVDAEPRRFPLLSKVQHQFRTVDTDRHFTIGLDALLDGLLTGGPGR